MIIDSDQNRKKILQAFIEISGDLGWSKDSLIKAFEDCDLDKKYIPLIFPNELLDVAKFYVAQGNESLVSYVKSLDSFKDEKIRDKIRVCLYRRFEVEKTNQKALLSLVDYYKDIKNFSDFEVGFRPLLQALELCFIVADEMWNLTNDQATDFNYYSKRVILSKIILRSFLVFLKDDSDDLDKTKKFIDEQIEKVMQFEKFKFKTKELVADLKESSKSFITNDDGSLKKPDQIIKNLPFIRLLKK